MKRSPALLKLSREHHPALVLAKHARLAGQNPAAARELAGTLPNVFAREIEPHFCEEERALLPLLAEHGCSASVERVLAEHRALRRLVERITQGDLQALEPFGIALAAHVRFEERELFMAAQALIEPHVLMHALGADAALEARSDRGQPADAPAEGLQARD